VWGKAPTQVVARDVTSLSIGDLGYVEYTRSSGLFGAWVF
jgi:hypothetical protein